MKLHTLVLLFFFISPTVSLGLELSIKDELKISNWQRGGKLRPKKGLALAVYDLENLVATQRYTQCKLKATELIKDELVKSWAESKYIFCSWRLFRLKKLSAKELHKVLEKVTKDNILSSITGSQSKLREYYKEALLTLSVRNKKITSADFGQYMDWLSDFDLNNSEKRKFQGVHKKLGGKGALFKAEAHLESLDSRLREIKKMYRQKKWRKFLKSSRKYLLGDKKSGRSWVVTRLSWLSYKLTRGHLKKKDLSWGEFVREVSLLSSSDVLFITRYLMGKAEYAESLELASASLNKKQDAALYLQAGFVSLLKGSYDLAHKHFEKSILKSTKDFEIKAEASFT